MSETIQAAPQQRRAHEPAGSGCRLQAGDEEIHGRARTQRDGYGQLQVVVGGDSHAEGEDQAEQDIAGDQAGVQEPEPPVCGNQQAGQGECERQRPHGGHGGGYPARPECRLQQQCGNEACLGLARHRALDIHGIDVIRQGRQQQECTHGHGRQRQQAAQARCFRAQRDECPGEGEDTQRRDQHAGAAHSVPASSSRPREGRSA